METIIKKRLCIALVLTACVMSSLAQDAGDILKKMDEVMFSPEDMTGRMKVVMTDKNEKQEIREE